MKVNVTISLDQQSYEIWKTIENRSLWVRQMLAYHGIAEAIVVRHAGTPHVNWGMHTGDARCNPASKCAHCWTLQEIRDMKGDPRQYVSDNYKTIF